MKLIFAQGNPEARFDGTRHNVGFMILDQFAKDHAAEWVSRPKFHADIAEISIDGEKVLLVKPNTYYNETGLSARGLIDFYKVDQTTDLLVIHDDLDLPLGTIRSRAKGSDAGNNGVKSLNAHLGENYHRLRVGIMSNLHHNDLEFVLGRFNEEERDLLKPVVEHSHKLINDFIHGDLELTSHSL